MFKKIFGKLSSENGEGGDPPPTPMQDAPWMKNPAIVNAVWNLRAVMQEHGYSLKCLIWEVKG